MLHINKKTKVFVTCPAYFKTGGTELLHQLIRELDKLHQNCYIYYYNAESMYPTVQEFRSYNVKFVKDIKEQDDNKDNIIIVPETLTEILCKFTNMQKVIWWLSVDNYIVTRKQQKWNKLDNIIDNLTSKRLFRFTPNKNKYMHLAQSIYAMDYLKGHNIKRLSYLSDYINSIYFEKKSLQIREDIVLYNPNKGIEFTNKLIAYGPHIQFVPLINLSNNEVRELLHRSKVYIDFGEHPGKDRFPREAAICGCCVITGKKGAANNINDIPIENKYKFEDMEEYIPAIINEIDECLKNFKDMTHRFDTYRAMIQLEEEQFKLDVAKIFIMEE